MERRTHNWRPVLVACVAAAAAVAEAPHPLMPTSGPYRIYEMPERTDLLTPEGTRKEVYGNFGPDGQGSYRVEIPLAALKPTETPTPEATIPAPEPTANERRVEATPTPIPSPSVTESVAPTPTALACATTPTVERNTAAIRPEEPESRVDIDPLVVKANRLYNQRRYVEASQYVDEILRRRPDYVRGWLMRGSLHQMLGHRDLASEAWQKARDLSGDDPEVRRTLEGLR